MTDTYRLKEIECDRFRGYAGRTKIHLDAPFVLLSGPNGSGKSSTLNAVEWALLGFDIASKSGTNIDERKDWRIRHDGAESASVTVYFSTSQSPAYVFRKMEGEADKGETKKKEKMKAEYGPVVMEQDAALRAHLGVELGDFYHAVYLHQETVRALMTEEPSLRKSGLDRLLGIAPLRDLVEGVKAAKVASKVKGAGESLRNLEELVKMRASDLQREKEQLRLRARQTWKLELDGIMGSQILEEANRLKVEGASKMRSLDLSGQPSEPPTLALALGPWLEEFKSFIRALPSKAPSGSIRKTLLEKQDKLARNQHAAEQVVKRRREILAQGDPVEKLSQTRGEMKRKEDERTVLVDAQEQFGLAAKVVGEAKRWLEHQGDHHELTCPVCQHSQDQGALRQTIEGELAKSGASQKSLLGKISVLDVELKRLYQTASVLLYTPHIEPFGLAAIEAMASGTPVVAVREGGPAETVVDGVTGFLCDRDPQQLGEAVLRLLDDAELRERMGRAAREHTVQNWTWDRSVEQLQALLTNALERLRTSKDDIRPSDPLEITDVAVARRQT